MTKVEVFSDRFVTKENLNGRTIIDLDTPEGVEIFGGQEAVDRYVAEERIQERMRELAIESLKTKGELPSDYEEENPRP